MSDYRKDARPTCASCGQSFVEDKLSLDEQGGLRCWSCSEDAHARSLDERARARNKSYRRERLLVWVCVAIFGLLVVALIAAFGVQQIRMAQRGNAARSEYARIHAPLAGVLAKMTELPRPQDDQACDDAALVPGATAAGEPWLLFSAGLGPGDAHWLSFPQPELDGDPAGRIAAARYVVALRGTDGPRSARFVDRNYFGDLIVFDRASGTPLCWAEVAYEKDASLRDSAAVALSTISKVLTLAR